MAEPILEVENLRVEFETDDGPLRAVDGVSFSLGPGTTLGIVGESGCGKSVTMMTMLGLTQGQHTHVEGSVRFKGRELLNADPNDLRAIRGDEIAMIFQDPLTSLHPFYRIGDQIVEAIHAHRSMDEDAARDRAVELLELVGIPDAIRRVGEFPHEFSGGMRQRAMIAMALANEPEILIADEPTTALDVTTQAQILRLLRQLQDDLGMAVVMITHDLGVIAEIAREIVVMYAGRVIEAGGTDSIFYDPQHPYTWGLLGSVTRLDRSRDARLAQIEGQPPSLVVRQPGCTFAPRCPHRFDKCATEPDLRGRSGNPGHVDRCWLDPERKRELRTMDSGEIGLEAA